MTDELEVHVDEETHDEPLTVREEITNALKESQERQAAEPADVDKPTRNRDDGGKFSKRQEVAEVGEKIATVSNGETVDPNAHPVKSVAAPQSWTAASKAKWSAIPPDIQAEIAKREEEVTKGFSRHDEERNFGKQLKDVINPYMPIINAEGGNPAAAVRDLLNTAYQLRTGTPQQKSALIREIARVYGADLTQLQPSPAAYVDPQVQSLQERLENIERQKQQESQYQQQQHQASIQSEVSAFASDPAYPHYETVKAHMAALLRGGVVDNLKDAYDQAVYARPDIRSTLLAQQHADAETKRRAEIKTKTQAARHASSSVTGSPGMAVPNKGAPDRSLREELQANMRAVLN